MDLLFYRYGSICEPDIIDAFRKLGFGVYEDTREVYNKKLLPSECIEGLSGLLTGRRYGFVFSINFHPSVSDICNIFGIPYICLIVDSPLLELFSTSIKNPVNRIFIFDRCLYNEFHPLNPQCIFYTPLATNSAKNLLTARNASPSVKNRFTHEISFIGSLYTEKCPYNHISLPDRYRGYVDGLIEAQLKVYGYNFIDDCMTDELVNAFLKAAPDEFSYPASLNVNLSSVIAQNYISVKVAEQERIRLLRLLSQRFDVSLYTGSDTSCIPLVKNLGFAKSITEMPVIFHNSKINLNMTAKSIRSGLSLRVFDVLGCEGFLITNYQEELPEYFEIGADLEAYTDSDELITKCEYYLSHEKDRQEIAHNGLVKVQQYHTYEKRLTRILETAFKL